MIRSSQSTRSIALGLTLCLVTPGLLEARVQPSRGFNMFSAQEEVQAGQQAAGIEQQFAQLIAGQVHVAIPPS